MNRILPPLQLGRVAIGVGGEEDIYLAHTVAS